MQTAKHSHQYLNESVYPIFGSAAAFVILLLLI